MPDAYPVAPVDLGGQGPAIHLAHANGFPPGTYRPLVESLTGQYRVVALPARPLWPGSRPESAPDWHPLVDDLICGLETLDVERPLIGIGHSLGGVVTMWAAARRPDLFRAVVLIDPVMLPSRHLAALRLLRRSGLERRLPLVRSTLYRRRTWPDRAACFAHYRDRPFFAAWSDEALWAYVEAGTREHADGSVELAYPPEWEAHIFATTPLDAWQSLPDLSVPALIVRGEQSETFRAECQARAARLLPAVHSAVVPDAGHLAPMERPAATAEAILAFLSSLITNGTN